MSWDAAAFGAVLQLAGKSGATGPRSGIVEHALNAAANAAPPAAMRSFAAPPPYRALFVIAAVDPSGRMADCPLTSRLHFENERSFYMHCKGVGASPVRHHSPERRRMARTANPDLAERRRRAILDAALVCFRRQGFHQTSMASICAEASISAGALYRYFPAKADIIAAIAEEDRQTVAAILEGALTTGDLLTDLLRMAEVLAERFTAQTSGPLLADVLGEASRDGVLCERLRRVDAEASATLVAAVRRAQRHGRVDPLADAEAVARILFAAVDGLCLRVALFGPGDAAPLVSDFRFLIERLLTPPLSSPAHAEAQP
jgi:TetR/AcrR family transcriptional regulator, repressor for uid operon